jgi:hypothetical protein
MENTFISIDSNGDEHITIDHGNGEFTSMLKLEYDRRQAEQSTPSLENGTIS